MGVSNSEILDLNSLEIDLLVKPTLDFQDDGCEIAPPLINGELYEIKQDDDQDQDQEEEEEGDKYKIMVPSLKIKIPSSGELKVEDEEYFDCGFKTPTTSDHKIPVVLQCPAAPRKPKSRPLLTKRKLLQSQRRVPYDLSNEIEALFPPALFADLGNKIKKAKQEN